MAVVVAPSGIAVAPPTLEILLPAGISFYTFQALSHTIDIYRGEMRARRSPIDFALFVAFFPHLVAGPITRAQNLLKQVEQPRTFDSDAARAGALLVMGGFFKKLVFPDNVAVIAGRVFGHESPSFEMLWAGVVCYCWYLEAWGSRTAIARALAALACVAADSVPGDRDGHDGRTVRHDSGLEEPDLF